LNECFKAPQKPEIKVNLNSAQGRNKPCNTHALICAQKCQPMQMYFGCRQGLFYAT